MRIVVTGGCGFIGSHVAAGAPAQGHDVVVVDCAGSVVPNTSCRSVDVTDAQALAGALSGSEVVIHLAAVADFREAEREPARAHAVNVGGTLNVLEAAAAVGARRVVYGSTAWVYDGITADTADERSRLQVGHRMYTATKLAGEMYCHALGPQLGLEVIVARLGTAYGPGSRSALMTSRFLSAAAAGGPLTVAGDGHQVRQLIYVEDLAAGILAAARKGRHGETYNLVGPTMLSVLDVAAAVQRVVADIPIEHVPARPGEVVTPFISAAKARRELGWAAETALDDGLRRQWRHHQDAPLAL